MAQRRDIHSLPASEDTIKVILSFRITKRFDRRMCTHYYVTPESDGIWVLGSALDFFKSKYDYIHHIEDVTNGFDGDKQIRVQVTIDRLEIDKIEEIKQNLCDYLEAECKAQTE